MARSEIQIEQYMMLQCNYTTSIVGNYPNVKFRYKYDFRLRTTGRASCYWNGYVFKFGGNTHSVNVNFTNLVGTTGVLCSGTYDVAFGTNRSCTSSVSFSCSGLWSGSGKIRATQTIPAPTMEASIVSCGVYDIKINIALTSNPNSFYKMCIYNVVSKKYEVNTEANEIQTISNLTPFTDYSFYAETWAKSGTGYAVEKKQLYGKTLGGAKIDSIDTGTGFLDNNITIKYTSLQSGYYHLLKTQINNGVVLSVEKLGLGNSNEQKTYKTIIPMLDEVYKTIPNSTSQDICYSIESYSDSNYTKKIVETSKKIVNLKLPISVIPTFTDFAIIPTETPNEWNYMLSGYSKPQIKINGASGISGSSIKSYIIDDVEYTTNTITLGVASSIGTLTYNVKVKDSRGRYSEVKSKSINVVAYSPPKFTSLTIDRCNSSGVVDNDEGTYIRFICSFRWTQCDGNTISAKLQYKNGDSWQELTSFTNGVATVSTKQAFEINKSYNLRFILKDLVYADVVKDARLETAVAIMDILHDKGIAFGKMASKENYAEFEYNVECNNNLFVDGSNVARTYDIAYNKPINNLLDLKGFPSSANGITITKKDGYYSLNGTASADTTIRLSVLLTFDNGIYTHSIDDAIPSTMKMRFDDDLETQISNENQTKTFVLSDSKEYTDYVIWIKSGTKLTNFDLKIMLVKGKYPLPFEKYTKIALENEDVNFNKIHADGTSYIGSLCLAKSEVLAMYDYQTHSKRYFWMGRDGERNSAGNFFFVGEDNIVSFNYNKPIVAPNMLTPVAYTNRAGNCSVSANTWEWWNPWVDNDKRVIFDTESACWNAEHGDPKNGIRIKKAGWYKITYSCRWADNGGNYTTYQSNNSRFFGVLVNMNKTDDIGVWDSAFRRCTSNGTSVVYLNAGDTLCIGGYSDVATSYKKATVYVEKIGSYSSDASNVNATATALASLMAVSQ